MGKGVGLCSKTPDHLVLKFLTRTSTVCTHERHCHVVPTVKTKVTRGLGRVGKPFRMQDGV